TSFNDLSADFARNGPHQGIHALAFDGGRVLAGTDGGIWRYSGAWSDLNGNLAISQLNGAALNPTNPAVAFAGNQSNGVSAFTGSLTWNLVEGNGGGQVYVDPTNPNNVYAIQTTLGLTAAVVVSRDGGKTWQPNPLLITTTPTAPLVLDPINPARFL